MNPFRPRTTMHITESDLIAFHLHELSLRREQAVLQAIESSPSLGAESDAVAASLRALKDVPMPIDDKVLERNWNALRPSLVSYTPPPLRAPRWRLPVFAGALAASAAVIAFVAHGNKQVYSPQRVSGTLTAGSSASLPAIGAPGPNEFSFLPSQPASRLNRRPDAFLPKPGPQQSESRQSIDGALSRIVPATPPALSRHSEPDVPPLPLSARTELPPADTSLQKPSAAPRQTPGLQAGTSQPLSLRRSGLRHGFDLMLAMGGNFIAPRNSGAGGSGETKETGSNAVTALAAIHQQIRPALGYRVTVSYSRPDYIFSNPETTIVNSRIYEVAGTYVVQGPHGAGFKTSADAGGGLLAFLPTVAAQFPGHFYRAAGVLGVNVDYAITRHWGARASYRAHVYKKPDFVSTFDIVPVANGVTFSNEPALGIVYNFGER